MMRRAGPLFVVLAVACSRSPKKDPAPPVPVVQATTAAPMGSAAAHGDGGRRNGGHGHTNGQEDRRDEPAVDAGALKLDAKIGGALTAWQKSSFDRVPRYAVGSDGEGREVWSLRDLAHTLVGPNARVVAVYGKRETRRLEPAVWNDAKRTPILHTTRRGTLKFRWADKDGTWDDAEISDVSLVEIEP